MTGPEHFVRAEQLAEEAHNHLGPGDEQATAAAWAAVAQAVPGCVSPTAAYI
jgi:hypothetical protein